jgi:hypothetical protein
MLERYGGLKGFQTSIYLGGYMGKIYLTHDVHVFYVVVTIWCEKLE